MLKGARGGSKGGDPVVEVGRVLLCQVGVSCAEILPILAPDNENTFQRCCRAMSEELTSFMGYINLLSILDWPTKLTGRLRSVM